MRSIGEYMCGDIWKWGCELLIFNCNLNRIACIKLQQPSRAKTKRKINFNSFSNQRIFTFPPPPPLHTRSSSEIPSLHLSVQIWFEQLKIKNSFIFLIPARENCVCVWESENPMPNYHLHIFTQKTIVSWLKWGKATHCSCVYDKSKVYICTLFSLSKEKRKSSSINDSMAMKNSFWSVQVCIHMSSMKIVNFHHPPSRLHLTSLLALNDDKQFTYTRNFIHLQFTLLSLRVKLFSGSSFSSFSRLWATKKKLREKNVRDMKGK